MKGVPQIGIRGERDDRSFGIGIPRAIGGGALHNRTACCRAGTDGQAISQRGILEQMVLQDDRAVTSTPWPVA